MYKHKQRAGSPKKECRVFCVSENRLGKYLLPYCHNTPYTNHVNSKRIMKTEKKTLGNSCKQM